MDIDQFKKLEEEIKEESFGKQYKNTNIVMFCLSIFGHISSIFLAYFMLSKILAGAITNSPLLVLLSSIILLSGLELLKRDFFQKFSSISIKLKTIAHKSVYPLLFISLAIVSISFYATIAGAKEFSSKAKQIEIIAEQSNKVYEDSLTAVYNTKIQDAEKESKTIKLKIDQKDVEQTSIESTPPLTSQQRNRVRDLKTERNQLREDLAKQDTVISNFKNELRSKITEYQAKIGNITNEKKSENKTNTLLFIIISTMIELVILAGVYFNRYYKIKSYNDFRIKVEKDPNYQKWILYDSIIDVIYNPDTKINDRAPSIKSIVELSKLNGVILLQKDATDFVRFLTSLNILRTSGGSKYFLKSKETAKETLKSHFSIK